MLSASMEANLVYTITYATPLPSACALHATTAKDALEIAHDVAARGHTPTIEHDGQKFSLRELEIVVRGVRFGDNA